HSVLRELCRRRALVSGRVEGQPPLPNGASSAHHAMRTATQFDGVPGSYDLSDHAKALATRFSGNAPNDARIVSASAPIMVGGLGTNAIAALAPLLSPLGLEMLQAGGGQNTSSQTEPVPDHYLDGGTVGAHMP